MRKYFIITAFLLLTSYSIVAASNHKVETIQGEGFDKGLVLENKDGLVIKNCRISNRDGNYGIKLINCSNVVIESCFISGISNESAISLDGNKYNEQYGYVFAHPNAQGIDLQNCKHVLILNNQIIDIIGQGIAVTGDDNTTTSHITIDSNRIAYIYDDGIKFQVKGDQSNPSEVMPFKGGVIRNNVIHDIGLGITRLAFARHGMYLKAADILVEKNIIYNCFYGAGVSLRCAGVIRGNTISNCARSCIDFWQQTNTEGSSQTVEIVDNICRQDFAMTFPMRHVSNPKSIHHLPIAIINIDYGTNGSYGWIDTYIVKNNKTTFYKDYDEKGSIPAIRFTNDPLVSDKYKNKTPSVIFEDNQVFDERLHKSSYKNIPVN